MEMWTNTGSRLVPGVIPRVSTKSGTTVMGRQRLNHACVFPRRKRLTAVTASLRSSPKRVAEANDASCPTRWMSVPWSVVIVRRRPPDISLAR